MPCLLTFRSTQRRWLGRCMGLLALLLGLGAQAQTVAFINPGKSTEAYWVAVAQSMQAAARSLGMTLTVHFAERDKARILELAHEIAHRDKAQRPRYLVLTNDYNLGDKLLATLEGSGIRCFFVFNTPGAAMRETIGEPRTRYPFWLGNLQPRAADAGYLTAKQLLAVGRAQGAHGPDGRLHVVAFAGDRATPASVERNAGMQRAIQEAGDAVLDQMVFSDWKRDKAAEQSEVLFRRHPQSRLFWAGSDQMIFGAMQSWEAKGGQPGRDAWFSGVNTSSEAMQAIAQGRLAALAGGHFIAGAWALVMLYDHAHGFDFANEGLNLERAMFSLFDAQGAKRFQQRFANGYGSVNFRRYSKALNPGLRHYDFTFAQLMR